MVILLCPFLHMKQKIREKNSQLRSFFSLVCFYIIKLLLSICQGQSLTRLLRSYKSMRPHINILSSTSIITPGMPRMPAIRQFRKVMPREKLKKPPIISSTISSRKPRPACSSSLIASFRGADNSFRKRYTPTMITASSSIADRSIKFPFRSALAERVGIYFYKITAVCSKWHCVAM